MYSTSSVTRHSSVLKVSGLGDRAKCVIRGSLWITLALAKTRRPINLDVNSSLRMMTYYRKISLWILLAEGVCLMRQFPLYTAIYLLTFTFEWTDFFGYVYWVCSVHIYVIMSSITSDYKMIRPHNYYALFVKVLHQNMHGCGLT